MRTSSLANATRRTLTAGLALGSAALLLPAAAHAAGEPTMPLDQVRVGMQCSVRSVIHGTAIDTFQARVQDVLPGSATGDGPRILVRVSGPAIEETGVGPGFSGSPVSCPDAAGELRIIGAISEGIGETTNRLVLVRPIQDILSEPQMAHIERHLMRLSGARPLAAPWSISGMPGWLQSAVQDGAQRANRTILSAPGAAPAGFAPVDLQPGSAMAVGLATGDLAVSAVGTVTYRDGQTVWGFGHPLDGAGARSLPLQDAYVYDVVSMPGFTGGSYKLAAPGHVLGTLRTDAPAAVVGTLGAGPRMIPVTVRTHDLDHGMTRAMQVQVADEEALDDPGGPSALRLVGAAATAQAAAAALDGGPARQTARMCLRVSVRGAGRPLGYCNRYVVDGGMPETLAGDVDAALSQLDANTFARLVVRSVTVDLGLRRGRQEAYLLSAKGPRTARPGGTVAVKAVVRRFRGPRRTLTLHVPIPRTATPGPTVIRLAGAASGGEGREGLAAIFEDIFGGGDPGTPTTSMGELSRRIAALGTYDGITARVGRGRQRTARIFRSPDMRIAGRTLLPVRITAVRHG